MDTTHLFDCLRSLSKFVYLRTRDELGFINFFQETMTKHKDHIWVLNAGFGGLSKIEDYLKKGFGQINPPTSSGVTTSHEVFFGAFKEIFSHDPKNQENFYIILDAEVWCADPLAQRLILNQADQLVLNDDRLVKSFIFVARTQDPIPEKVSDLFEVIEEGSQDKVILAQVASSFKNLHWDPPPPDEVCLEIFKGMTSYQIDATIIRAFIAVIRPASRVGDANQTTIILDAVSKIIGFKEPNLLQAQATN